VKLYYQMSGWDEQGKPLPAKLIELNLEFLLAC
jgi:aldehyde:ferredoxin oxidoreductase